MILIMTHWKGYAVVNCFELVQAHSICVQKVGVLEPQLSQLISDGYIIIYNRTIDSSLNHV